MMQNGRMRDPWLEANYCLAVCDWKNARRWARMIYPDAWFPLLRVIREGIKLLEAHKDEFED